jgi:deoxyribodipyrimidine photo-lyase
MKHCPLLLPPQVLPMYCWDPRHFAASRNLGGTRTTPFRAQFIMESLAGLKTTLQGLGSDLGVSVGKPEDVILKYELGLVLISEEVTSEEIRTDSKVAAAVGSKVSNG